VIRQHTPGRPEARGIAIGHEAGALLVAHADVAHLAVGEAAIELERVDARDSRTPVSTP
jgi:hypothetical protein